MSYRTAPQSCILLRVGAAIRSRRRQAMLSAQATFLDDELARSRVAMLAAAATRDSVIESVLLSQVAGVIQTERHCLVRRVQADRAAVQAAAADRDAECARQHALWSDLVAGTP
jgi:hypothetical protein